jgi:hypothetical protein
MIRGLCLVKTLDLSWPAEPPAERDTGKDSESLALTPSLMTLCPSALAFQIALVAATCSVVILQLGKPEEKDQGAQIVRLAGDTREMVIQVVFKIVQLNETYSINTWGEMYDKLWPACCSCDHYSIRVLRLLSSASTVKFQIDS